MWISGLDSFRTQEVSLYFVMTFLYTLSIKFVISNRLWSFGYVLSFSDVSDSDIIDLVFDSNVTLAHLRSLFLRADDSTFA